MKGLKNLISHGTYQNNYTPLLSEKDFIDFTKHYTIPPEEREFIMYTGERGERLFNLYLMLQIYTGSEERRKLCSELIESGDKDNFIIAEQILNKYE